MQLLSLEGSKSSLQRQRVTQKQSIFVRADVETMETGLRLSSHMFCRCHRYQYSIVEHCKTNKKTVLSQRWPRNAPYTWVPWIFSGLPNYAHGYYFQHFSWAFVRIDPVNVPTKFDVRSFTNSWDNRGYPKNWTAPGYAHAPFFPNFFMGFYSDWPCKCTRQIWSP